MSKVTPATSAPKEEPPSPVPITAPPKVQPEGETNLAALKPLELLKSSVVGGRVDRLVFWGVVVVATCLFLSSAIGLIQAAATGIVTNVTFVLRPTFEFPGMFFCFLNTTPASAANLNFVLLDGSAAKPFTMITGLTCTSGAYVATYKKDGSLLSKTCVTLDTTGTSAAAKAIQSYLKNSGPADTATSTRAWACSIANANGKLQAQRGQNMRMIVEGQATPDAKATNFVVLGYYDPKLPAKDILTKNFNVRFLSIYNRIAEVGFTMDQVTDVSTTVSLNPQQIKGNEASMTKKYHSTLSQALLVVEQGNEGAMNSIWQFSISSFLGRDLLIRKKAFSEVWAEIGGCWTASLMLVGIFFTRRSLSGAEGNTIQAHVPRFRGESTKRSMLGELRAYVGSPAETALKGAASMKLP